MKALYGQWDMSRRDGPFPYDDTITYRAAGEFLDAPMLVEDWGCGGAWLKRFLPRAEYRGIDGAEAPWVDVLADLRFYRSDTPRANMRHVLEHNPEWRSILANFLRSWTEKATIITWVPFLGEGCPYPCPQDVLGPDHVGDVDHGDGHWPVPDLHIPRAHFTEILDAHGVSYSSTTYETTAQYRSEEIFFLVR